MTFVGFVGFCKFLSAFASSLSALAGFCRHLSASAGQCLLALSSFVGFYSHYILLLDLSDCWHLSGLFAWLWSAFVGFVGFVTFGQLSSAFCGCLVLGGLK